MSPVKHRMNQGIFPLSNMFQFVRGHQEYYDEVTKLHGRDDIVF